MQLPGGYYLAMACDTIVAQPTTITGSIGVFSVLFDMSSFLDNKIGITFEEVKTGEIGELITVTRPLNAVEKISGRRRLKKFMTGLLLRLPKAELCLWLNSGRLHRAGFGPGPVQKSADWLMYSATLKRQ